MNDDLGVSIFGIVALACVFGYFIYILYYIADLYFFTPSKKNIKLSAADEHIIVKYLPAYSLLSPKQKQKFRNRVSRFRANKTFIFSEKSSKDEEIKLLLSATAAFLMLGFKDYRIATIHKILIYPSAYFSTITKQNHLGEYNPQLKTLVFSAEHVLSGFEDAADNLNLGVHEFAHALAFHFKKDLKYTAVKFRKGMAKMEKLLNDKAFLERVERTKYFRPYATTNIHEFFAVTLENYVETPSDFVATFPELYNIITRMLNFEEFSFHHKL
ncbi:MAG: zinc-dependent peptidase [Cellulophaga sp.]